MYVITSHAQSSLTTINFRFRCQGILTGHIPASRGRASTRNIPFLPDPARIYLDATASASIDFSRIRTVDEGLLACPMKKVSQMKKSLPRATEDDSATSTVCFCLGPRTRRIEIKG